ncbi:MAG: NnrS family protein [Hyphomicrobiaceae bacterium]
MTTSEQIRAFTGPAVLSFGFRPFFLAGALWAALAVALWLPILSGHVVLPSRFAPLDWHVHELIFGYVPAVMAGFLLTAVPNWTGRLPVTGLPLLGLFAIWLSGRLSVFFSAWIGSWPAAGIDLLFLGALTAVIAREIIAGQSTRNLKVLAVLALLFTGNAVFHVEVLFETATAYGTRVGISAVVLLVMVIGGRIVPSFTRNWLAKRNSEQLPAPFDRIDVSVLALSAATLACWITVPGSAATATLSLIAALANTYRLARWAGTKTLAEPLVSILHGAYACVPVGFALLAISIWRPDVVTPSGALHGWTTGAIGLMTLAVMTRASLGHTGQALIATRPTKLIYVAAILSVATRIIAAFDILRETMLYVSAFAWVLAFAGFVVVYAPHLLRRQV